MAAGVLVASAALLVVALLVVALLVPAGRSSASSSAPSAASVGRRPSVAHVPEASYRPRPPEPVAPVRHPAAADVRTFSALPRDLPGPATSATPERLVIERLGLSAEVTAVGVDGPGAAMRVPEDGLDVGWYRFGPAPGAPNGVAVLSAHVDTAVGGPGAFFRLRDLRPGDRVRVRDERDRRHTFTVVGREQVGKADLPVAELFRASGPPALALVTCGGAFDPELRRYADNVIVWAEPTAG